MATLQLNKVFKSFGDVEVVHGVDLDIEHGEFVVLVGPSGCGKSTLLRMIAGLEQVSGGDIIIDDERVNEVPAAHRRLAMVFQSYALYPHMTVYQNLAFGLENVNTPRAEVFEAVGRAARMLQIEELLARKPRQLSGGQRQRVAIGRAIVRNPRIFLFDEPLSNLDAELRVQMRVELSDLHERIGNTMIYVTHDQTEAMTMADKIVVLRSGNVEQVGRPLDLYNNPQNRFVAGFIGSPRMNFLEGEVLRVAADGVIVDIAGVGEVKSAATATNVAAGEPVSLGIRPEHIGAGTKGTNTARVRVIFTEQLGSASYLYCELPTSVGLTIHSPGQTSARKSDTIDVSFPPEHCYLFKKKPARNGPAPLAERKLVRCAIIGLGMAVTPHAKSLLDLRDSVEVAGAYSPTAKRRNNFAQKFELPVTDDLDGLIDDPSIDYVVLLTPPNARMELVKRIAGAGKHILMEKPIERSTAAAEEIVTAAERAGITLGIVLQHRFRAAAERLGECVADGSLGEIAAVNISVPWWRPQSYYDEPGRGTYARDGGGVLISQAIHTIDVALSLAGPVDAVVAVGGTTPIHHMESEDFVAAGIRFTNGAHGSLMATTSLYPGGSERVELICTRATAVLNAGGLAVRYHDGRKENVGETQGSGGGADPMDFPHDAHRALHADFINAISNHSAPRVTGRATLQVHRFIDAIIKATKNMAPVHLRQD